TFDDGDPTLTTRAAPLLRSYGLRGIGFVVAGLVPQRSDGRLRGWTELRAAGATGAIEVGAHSLFHHHVPVSPRVIGAVDDTTSTDFHASIPVPRIPGDAAVRAGEPILRGRPGSLARAAFRPAEGAFERWAQSGGTAAIQGTYETDAEADQAVIDDMRH